MKIADASWTGSRCTIFRIAAISKMVSVSQMALYGLCIGRPCGRSGASPFQRQSLEKVSGSRHNRREEGVGPNGAASTSKVCGDPTSYEVDARWTQENGFWLLNKATMWATSLNYHHD